MWFSGKWDKHVRCWASYRATQWSPQFKVTSPFFPLPYRLLSVSSYWQPWWSKQVLPLIEDQLALVKWNQCAGNEQARLSSVLNRECLCTQEQLIWVTDSGLIVADKTFMNHHRNAKFVSSILCYLAPCVECFLYSCKHKLLITSWQLWFCVCGIIQFAKVFSHKINPPYGTFLPWILRGCCGRFTAVWCYVQLLYSNTLNTLSIHSPNISMLNGGWLFGCTICMSIFHIFIFKDSWEYISLSCVITRDCACAIHLCICLWQNGWSAGR